MPARPGLLFLCHDGAARGPIAEALTRHLDPARTVAAAALAPGHVRRLAREVLAEEGVECSGLRARDLLQIDMDDIDVVIILDESMPSLRLPARLQQLCWPTPDPTCAPPAEAREAMRACRDRLHDRLRRWLAAPPAGSPAPVSPG